MSLDGAVRAFNEKVKNVVGDDFRARVVALTNDAIRNTPVDTGRLMGNWQIGFGSKPSGNPYTVGSKRKGDEAMATSASSNRIATAANSNRRQNVTEAYITNNLPYALAVEKGGPTNRPRRMLARAILRATKKP